MTHMLFLVGVQVEIAKGATEEELKANKYYDFDAINFIENVCTFLTLDAAHRHVVRPPPRPPFFFPLKLTTCSQAIYKLKAVLDPAAPEKVLCWVVDGTLDRSLLWKLSWVTALYRLVPTTGLWG